MSGCFIMPGDNCTGREKQSTRPLTICNLIHARCQLAVTSQTSGQTHLLTQNTWPCSSVNDCACNCACVLWRGSKGGWWGVCFNYIYILIINKESCFTGSLLQETTVEYLRSLKANDFTCEQTWAGFGKPDQRMYEYKWMFSCFFYR